MWTADIFTYIIYHNLLYRHTTVLLHVLEVLSFNMETRKIEISKTFWSYSIILTTFIVVSIWFFSYTKKIMLTFSSLDLLKAFECDNLAQSFSDPGWYCPNSTCNPNSPDHIMANNLLFYWAVGGLRHVHSVLPHPSVHLIFF